DDAGVNRCLHGSDEWITAGRFVDRMAKRHVDNVDAKRLTIRNSEIERRDDVTRVSGTRVIQRTQHDEAAARSNASILTARCRPCAAYQSRDMRAVTEGVLRSLLHGFTAGEGV